MALSPRARGSLSPLSVPVSGPLPTSLPPPAPRSCWRITALRIGGARPPVNAWWGSFDLAVSLFSGASANPPSDNFIMRNAMDSQEVAVGW